MRTIVSDVSNTVLANRLRTRYGVNGLAMSEFILFNLPAGGNSLDFTNELGAFRARRLSTGITLIKFN